VKPATISPPEFRGAALRAQNTTAEEWLIAGPSETGKTWAALWRLDTLLRSTPKARAALVRKVRADVDATVLLTYQHLIARSGSGAAVFGGNEPKWFDYPNGARLYIGGMDRPGKVLSGERDWIYVNQAEELAIEDWETLSTRTTGRGAVTETPMLFGDCNPGPEDHWIMLRPQITRLDSRHEDNPALYGENGQQTPQGERTMRRLDALTGIRYQRLRMGRWVGAEGAYYTQLDEALHIVDYARAPDGWRAWAALDYGFAHLLSFGVFVSDPYGSVYVLGRHAAHHWYIKQHATVMDELLAALGISPYGLKIVAGLDCWNSGKDDPETIADKFANEGFLLERANAGPGSRVNSARIVGERLGNPEAGIAPSLFFNRRYGGKAVFDALARMVHDPHNEEDVRKVNADAEGRGGDDDFDMLRYGVMEAGALISAAPAVGGQRAATAYRPR
jgi:hypothetical protein